MYDKSQEASPVYAGMNHQPRTSNKSCLHISAAVFFSDIFSRCISSHQHINWPFKRDIQACVKGRCIKSKSSHNTLKPYKDILENCLFNLIHTHQEHKHFLTMQYIWKNVKECRREKRQTVVVCSQTYCAVYSTQKAIKIPIYSYMFQRLTMGSWVYGAIFRGLISHTATQLAAFIFHACGSVTPGSPLMWQAEAQTRMRQRERKQRESKRWNSLQWEEGGTDFSCGCRFLEGMRGQDEGVLKKTSMSLQCPAMKPSSDRSVRVCTEGGLVVGGQKGS